MTKTVELTDGREVTIRPLTGSDLEQSLAFFKHLPSEDRLFLRHDVTIRDNVARRIQEMEAGRILRLVAIVGDEIVADGSLELASRDWGEHIAELRLIVSHAFQRVGLGRLMARELYFLASEKKVEEIIVRFMAPQVGALNIFTRLGFHEDARLPEYVKDLGGHKQDLVIMRCNLGALWDKLESESSGADWQRTR